MRIAVVPAIVAALVSCASDRSGPLEKPTDSVIPWKEQAERNPGRFAPRLYVAYDAVSRRDWAEFDRLSRSLEEQAEVESKLSGPLGTLFLAAGQAGPAARSAGWLEKARRALEKGCNDPDCGADLPFNLGAVCFLLRDYPAASTALQQSLERKPDHADAVTLLVRSLLEQGEPAGALRWLEKAHSTIAAGERLELTGLCHYMMGQHAQAIQAYEASLEVVSGSVRLWHNLGLCYEESRQTEKARECFAKADALRRSAPGNSGPR